MDLFSAMSDRPSLEEYVNKSTDWRLPENRMEAFRRVTHTRLMEGECDHWLVGKVIVDWLELTDEQKAWYALIFGYSYRNHWAMICLQTFPRIWEVDHQELLDWYNDREGEENGVWRKVCFAKDTKWNVRKFPEFIKSVVDDLNGRNLKDVMDSLVTSDSAADNFDNLNSYLIGNYTGIGRMTSWLTIQTLYEFFDYNVDKWDFQLKDDGCWSQYRALCYLADRPDILENKTKESAAEMEAYAKTLMAYLNDSLPYIVDVYNVESILCEYRKTAAEARAREFTGWTINELMYEFHLLEEKWPNINWTPYVLALMSKGKKLCIPGYDKVYFQVIQKTGLNFNTHHYFDDEPNAFEEVFIPRPEECPPPIRLLEFYESIPEEVRLDYLDRFEPTKHLRWK